MSLKFFTDGYYTYARVYQYRPIILALFEFSSPVIAGELTRILNCNSKEGYPTEVDLEFCQALVTALVRKNPENLTQIVRAGLRGIEDRKL